MTTPDAGLAMAFLECEFPGYEVRRLPSGAVCATARSLAAHPWCVAGTLGEVRARGMAELLGERR